MTKNITNAGNWKPGQSGNPKGRPPKSRMLTELLRAKGEEVVSVGGEVMTGQEALANAVWQLALQGEVWLSGRRLSAESVTEWASVVKWLYSHVEPPYKGETSSEPELIVHVVREDRTGEE